MEVVKTLRRCGSCGQEFENTRDPDWRIGAYAQFRAAKGWITPEMSQTWRRHHNLGQDDVCRILGWPPGTLARYERGALQSEAHNTQLTDLMATGGLAGRLA